MTTTSTKTTVAAGKTLRSLSRAWSIFLLVFIPTAAHNSNSRRRGIQISVTPKVSLASSRSTSTTMSSASTARVVDLEELGFARLEEREKGALATVVKSGPKEPAEASGKKLWNHPVSLLGILGSAVYLLAFRTKNTGDAPPIMRGGRQLRALLQPVFQKEEPAAKWKTPADDHPLTLQNQAVLKKQGVFKWLTSSEKLPWTLCTIASLVYLAAFVSRVSCDKGGDMAEKLCWKPLISLTEGLHNGFCVFGADVSTGFCESELHNSHQFSFYVDMAMTALAFIVGHVFKKHASFPYTFGIGLIIGLHGLLHRGISHGMECAGAGQGWLHCCMNCPGTDPDAAQPWQWALYTFYNLGLVLLNFSVANFKLPLPMQFALIGIITAAFVSMGGYLGGAWALPAVFVQTHVMASITGIFANQNKLSPLTGWCFLVATGVGLAEFLACEPFLLQRYGHVWYDTILHVAMIATLIPRKNSGKAVP